MYDRTMYNPEARVATRRCALVAGDSEGSFGSMARDLRTIEGQYTQTTEERGGLVVERRSGINGSCAGENGTRAS